MFQIKINWMVVDIHEKV